MREAAEAGRRQKEEQRRKEHDEMFSRVRVIIMFISLSLITSSTAGVWSWTFQNMGSTDLV